MNVFFMTIFILAFMPGCSRAPALSEEQIVLGQLRDQFIAEMAKNEQMAVYGSGGEMLGGEKKDKISKFSFSFATSKLVDINEARSITLRCTEKFLKMVNVDEKIRPFLGHYPYTVLGFELTLKFLPFEESNPHSSEIYVHTVLLFDNKIYYRQFEHQLKEDVTLIKETYEEALEAEKKRIEQIGQKNG